MFSVIESGIQFRLDRVPLRQMIAQRIILNMYFLLIHEITSLFLVSRLSATFSDNFDINIDVSRLIPPMVLNINGVKVPCSLSWILVLYFSFFLIFHRSKMLLQEIGFCSFGLKDETP